MRRALGRAAGRGRSMRWPTAATCRPACPATAEALVKGDQRSQSIAAASIVAKVMRDRMMQGCGKADQRYGFEVHMGYATERHRAAIEVHGPVVRLHRLSFSPFRLGAVEGWTMARNRAR